MSTRSLAGAIFLLPASIAAEIGTWSPIGFVLAGFAMLLIASCYAETASRFSDTGGAYIYARAAFGNLIGFEIGWMQWFVRVSSQAAIVSGIASALTAAWPAAAERGGHALLVSAVTLLVGYWHTTGIRQSAGAINFFTVSKLISLLVLIAGGVLLADWGAMDPLRAISPKQATTAGLLLVFAYGGFESVAVLAGEVTRPQRDVPFALGATILSAMFIMAAAQAVYVATAPGHADAAAPLVASARVLLGWTGALMLGAGSVISAIGNNVGSSLAASRMLFAFAENGDVPDRVRADSSALPNSRRRDLVLDSGCPRPGAHRIVRPAGRRERSRTPGHLYRSVRSDVDPAEAAISRRGIHPALWRDDSPRGHGGLAGDVRRGHA